MSNYKLLSKTNVIVAVILLIVWALVANRYYGPQEPLSQDEVEQHMANLKNMFMEVGVPDGNGDAGDVEKTMSVFRTFAEQDDGKPIYMVNLMKWRDQTVFRSHIKGVEGMSVEDADLAYNEQLFYELAKNASHTAYLSKAFDNALNFGFNTDQIDNWGEIGIFRYSSRRDFFNMVGSNSYLSMVYFKFASMGHIAIVPTQPHGLLFNPMPNLPVLLAFLFIIGFLVFLLMRSRKV